MKQKFVAWWLKIFIITLTLIDVNFCSRYKEYTDNRHIGIIPHDVYPGYIIQTFQEQNPQHYNVYHLLKTEYSSYFTILNNGQVMTVSKLTPLINKQIKLIIIEEIPNGNITHILKLHIINSNKMLKFSRDTYEGGTILENQPPFTRVIGLPNIFVVGEGLHANSDSFPLLKHRIIEGNEGDSFVLKHINTEISHNGSYVNSFKILSKKSFDREERSKYVLTIQVIDAKGIDKVTAKVFIEILDENDNSPTFKLPVYEFFVGNFQRWLHEYNKTFGIKEFPVLGAVEAVDADDKDSIVYQLSTPTDIIIVVPQTGEVVLTGNPLNMTAGSKMEFVVEAHDLRPPFRTSSLPAQIWLNIFRQPMSQEIYGQYLDKFTNDLYYNEPYSFLRQQCISKKWHFCDGGIDINDVKLHRNMKKLKKNGNSGSKNLETMKNIGLISENSMHRIIKRRVTRAVRPTKRIDLSETDGENEGRVVFQVEKEAERETFKMREENPWVSVEPSGAVRVKKKWDYEELGPEKVIDFWVVITNPGIGSPTIGGKPGMDSSNVTLTKSGHDAHTDNQRIIIALRDVNDEPPYFINRPLPMQAVVQLNAPPNTPVFTLQARDPDTDANIHYFIVRDRTGGRFEVDERSGVVRTRGTDPFQLDMEYVLYVKAEDQNGRIDDRRYQSTPEERLSIVGGKRAPQFYMQTYEAEIPENQRKDSDIISVKAKSFADREIRYTLKAQGQGAGTFNIGPSSGIVKLAKELDFEDLRQPHVYSLIVTATEDSGGFSTSVELTIRVTDVNDNAPKFELPDYQAHNVDEDYPLGTSILKVKAVDADSGANAEIEYHVSDDHFVVDASGIVSNNKQLDADNNNAYYEFVITAKDKGEPPQTGTATVRIYTKNKNDEEPKFSQQVYTPNVDENAGPNTLVTTVVASDKDGDNVKFGFVGGGTSSGQFVIEEITGVIRLHSKPITLDRDKYELNVTAVDDGSCCLNGDLTIHTSTAVVVVFITDVNDNKPVFKDCGKYTPKISEGTGNGHEVIKVQAIDEDKGVNGQVKYSIVQQPNQKGTKFIVDEESGQITSNKVFDREGDDGKFVSVTVKAVDQGDPSLEGVCSFTVEITDINDNPPLFDRQKYVENVKQDASIGTNILRVSASDEDADNNGAIVYSLSAPESPQDLEYFEIQPESGWIVLRKPLDRDKYRLRARASDRGEPPSFAEVDVALEVVDRNNKPPIWDMNVYGPYRVKENVTVGTVVTSVKASSGIEGNPFVFYRLMPGSTAQTNKHHTFYLQQRPENGFTWADIKVNHPLDYESIKEYNLTIRVENNGAQQLASEATVYIMIDDVNDEIPLFTEREQETVLEGEPIGTKVTQVNAIDKDGTSPNNKVYYYVVDSQRNEGKDFFEINRETGEIFTKVVFDREKQGAYALEIEARDGSPSARPNSQEEPNSVTKFIRIGIADKNDNPPYFDKGLYEAEVDENEDIQHTVLTVTAKDHDESSRIRYEITSGNLGGAFAVKNMTGAIYVAGPLDYETRKRYELRLSASDNLRENHTTVVIHVKDVNDNPPVFERPTYRTQITEEDDRNLPKSVVQYELTLVASDSLNESKTTVVIHINDVNDMPPVFDQPVYTAVMEEESPGPYPYKLLKVKATDGDKDRQHNIVYFLTGQGIDPDNPANSKFDINRTSGEIYVLKPLDRDQPNGRPQWRFTVFAQDEGGEGLVGYADVQVNLKDVNDNAPLFPQGVYFGNVTENGTAGMVVMTMTAVDYDDPSEASNAKLVYSIEKNVIEEETGSPIFEIEPDTGVIKTAVCCLDRERTPDYSIQVVAMDGGGLKGTGTASIRVKDINDMPPQFTKDEWYTEVDETEGTDLPESPILTVTVHDEDETNKFQYKVIENSGYGADKFTMVRNNDGTGSLKIVQPLDFEDQLQSNGFRFRIQVNDKGEDNDNDKYHVAYSWVVVKLRDINDNKPQFERPNIEVSVYENEEIGKSLETFKATDPDQGGKSKISFAIDRSSDRRRQFLINPEGTVTIQRHLDREDTPRHQVKILAIDDGMPSKTATATLTVIVQDINDNAPKFLRDYRPILTEHVPPRKVVEVLATDDDDRSKSNGPPFTFRLDPNADDVIRASFKVEHDQKGANGDGMAVVSSLRSFDREQQKEYLIPIVIKDAGNPAMSGTSTLTVIIGDVNDNKMQPGSKEILVYNYLSKNLDYSVPGPPPDIEIGRIYVHDLDDWDLGDKTFHWDDVENPYFKLAKTTGMIGMRPDTRSGVYHLRFKAFDRKHTQSDIAANVTVTVRDISLEAILKSGSVRIDGITDEDFIRVWNYRTQSISRSKADHFRDKLANILDTNRNNIDVFSVQLRRRYPPITDVRFSVHSSPYQDPVKLNGRVLMYREEIEREVGINITMVGIDECLYENTICEGSCTNVLDVTNLPYLVNANKTALVGVRIDVIGECICGARNYTDFETCSPFHCLNNGRCIENKGSVSCKCPLGFSGPRCQAISRSFKGNGWAWLPPLQVCEKSHLSIEFATRKGDGLLLYNGPIVAPEPEEILLSDFISLELDRGQPRLLIDFGSGTLELKVKTKKPLDDGDWHRVDIFWDTENVRLLVDRCKSADISELEDGTPPEFDGSSCQAVGSIPPFNEYLNLNTPLQIGGRYIQDFDPTLFHWQAMPYAKGFDGCIRNIYLNGILYDLAHPGLAASNSKVGCPQAEELCNSQEMYRCRDHGICVGNLNEPKCECLPGWSGNSCSVPTIPVTFNPQSYVKYALSFEPDKYSTHLQLRFRTREKQGELFRISDQHNREYAILELRERKVCFRYNLNSLRTEEKDVWLDQVAVDDGQWHTVKVSRYGSSASLQLDDGEGRMFNETFVFDGHQWLMVDKQEGVYAGGKAEYTGVRTYDVLSDYQKGCMDDIRLEGKPLPLPPAMNGTQWGQATTARNVERKCLSRTNCKQVDCKSPLVCVDNWNEAVCACGPGKISAGDKRCVDKNECLEKPCLNNGQCENLGPESVYGYRCVCAEGFLGHTCELHQQEQSIEFGLGALAAILVCILLISGKCCPSGYQKYYNICVNEDECSVNPCLNGGTCKKSFKDTQYVCYCLNEFAGIHCELPLYESGGIIVPSAGFLAAVISCVLLLIFLVLIFVVFSRRQESHMKYAGPDDDVRENIINYDDEGGGEDDMTAYDITPLQIPIAGGPLAAEHHGNRKLGNCLGMGSGLGNGIGVEPNVGIFIEEHKKRADGDLNAPPYDDLRNYAYEGAGSTAGSLSSLASGTDDEQHDYDYLNVWGPRFDKLADMYGHDPETDLEDDDDEELQ